MNYNYGESCTQCGKSIPDYSNLDFHIATEHKAQEVTQQQLEDARDWWSTTKTLTDKSWAEMRIGERQVIISRYADCMWNKYVAKERDLKPTGKNHGIDFYIDLALDDYLKGVTHTPEEYEKRLYGLELHVKDWWDSRNIKNEKGIGKRRKWDDLNNDERKEIKIIFKDKVKDEYLECNESSIKNWWNNMDMDERVDKTKLFEYKSWVELDSNTQSIIHECYVTEGGFGSGKIGHVKWMRDIEYGGNYKVCPTCKVNTSFENSKCLICGN